MEEAMMKALERFLLRDYLREKQELERLVVKRYARGNVSIQDGSYMLQADADKLARQADRFLATAA